MSLQGTVRKALELLPDGSGRSLSWVVFIALVAAGLETLSVAFIFPFLAVAMDPTVTDWAWQLQLLQEWTGLKEVRSFQIFLGVIVLVLVVVANLAGAFSKWVQARFTWQMTTGVSQGMMDLYLRQPYTYHIQRNPAHMRVSSFGYANQVMGNVVRPTIDLVRASATILGIFAVLLLARPVISLGVAAFFGLSYLGIYIVTRAPIGIHGRRAADAARERDKVGVQAFQAIKEVKFFGVEPVLVSEARTPTHDQAKSTNLIQVYGQIPFHVLQIIAFGGLMGVFIILLVGLESLDTIIPTLGFFAFAGYRMLPAFQQMFAGVTTMRGAEPVVDSLHMDWSTLEPRPHQTVEEKMRLHESIRLDGVGFTYHGKEEPAVAKVHATIPKGASVAFVGHSGSGKTTLLDIILGLLPPTTGDVLVDDVAVDKHNALAWRQNVGYVPQDVSLHDMSIAENIAFGVAKDQIDMDRVREAARLAHMDRFIEEEIPDGYATTVGDRGTRLSGGQRQRIGIARALYRGPDVLVFDEATSSLDSVTEREITRAIKELSGQKTIILVAHRLTTVKHCDTLFVMDGGRLVSQGTYDELLETDPHFRTLALEHEDEPDGPPAEVDA